MDSEEEEEDDDDNNTEINGKSTQIMYNDFFGNPSSSSKNKRKLVTNTDYDDEDFDHEQSKYYDDDDKQDTGKSLTEHQRKQIEKLNEIRKLEAELVGEKPWDMKGEVRASDRPENSLLEISADMERLTSFYYYCSINSIHILLMNPELLNQHLL
jgi:U3 small nucleolar RNA-associated protein MPP10